MDALLRALQSEGYTAVTVLGGEAVRVPLNAGPLRIGAVNMDGQLMLEFTVEFTHSPVAELVCAVNQHLPLVGFELGEEGLRFRHVQVGVDADVACFTVELVDYVTQRYAPIFQAESLHQGLHRLDENLEGWEPE